MTAILLSVPLAGLPASAAEAPPAVETIDAADLTAASTDPATEDDRAKAADEFMADGANSGVLYDDDEVSSAVVGDTTVAWSDSVDLSKVIVSPGTTDDSPIDGIGAIGSNDPNATDVKLTEMGSESLGSVSGQWGNVSGGVVQVTVSGYKLLSGWERWRVRETNSDREVYYYGHWATAVGKSVSGPDKAPYQIDIRSRPKSGLRSTFLQLRNYYPKTSSPSCGSSGSISVSALGFGGSLPMQNCSSLSPDPDANAIQMKVVWDAGKCKNGTTEGADLALIVDTKPSKVAILSDYSYARFDTSGGTCNIDSGDDVRAIYKDPGW
jgi:hypothetical protein